MLNYLFQIKKDCQETVNAQSGNLWSTSNGVMGEEQNLKRHMNISISVEFQIFKKNRLNFSNLAPQGQFRNQALHVITVLV